MKNTALLVGAVSILGGIGIYLANQEAMVEVVKDSHDPVVKIETVDTLSQRIQAAQETARPEIEAEAQVAYEKHVESELEAIRQQVTADYIAELEETITDPAY